MTRISELKRKYNYRDAWYDPFAINYADSQATNWEEVYFEGACVRCFFVKEKTIKNNSIRLKCLKHDFFVRHWSTCDIYEKDDKKLE